MLPGKREKRMKLSGNLDKKINSVVLRTSGQLSPGLRMLLIACLVGVFAVLTACSPTMSGGTGSTATSSQESQQADENDEEAVAIWTATVTGAERWSGSFQGEQGNAIVQDGKVLELELTNRVFDGWALYFDSPTVDSDPAMISLDNESIVGATGGAILKHGSAQGSIPQNAYFGGTIVSQDLVVGENSVSGSFVLALKNEPGETVEVRVEFVDVQIFQ